MPMSIIGKIDCRFSVNFTFKPYGFPAKNEIPNSKSGKINAMSVFNAMLLLKSIFTENAIFVKISETARKASAGASCGNVIFSKPRLIFCCTTANNTVSINIITINIPVFKNIYFLFLPFRAVDNFNCAKIHFFSDTDFADF
jgi:hypothetical protein